MKKFLKSLASAVVFLALSIFLSGQAQAATLYMVPKAGDLKAGQNFSVTIMINTDNSSFNAVQGTIQFPKDLLQVISIDSSPSASIFNFWLEGPVFSNETGRIHFIGGTTNGISGKAIPALKINFQAKNSGEAPLQFTDSAITAADGSGSNILTNMEVSSFQISAAGITGAAAGTSGAQAPVTPPPVLITRTPTEAEGLPTKPQVSVSLYSDSNIWYNVSSEFLARWNLPSDISAVATKLDNNATFFGTASEGLFESKVFPAITEDGVWYLHVRFKNNIGWGPAANFKIKLDTRPPSHFKPEFLTGGAKSDIPNPKIRFVSSDAISGISGYEISIDDSVHSDLKDKNFEMPPQAPGIHRLHVKIFDNAGNFIEDRSEFEILPIASPTIDSFTPGIFVGENRIVAAGSSLQDTTILFSIKETKGALHFQQEIPVDPVGGWAITVDHYLPVGKYYVEVQARDERSALSLPIKSEIVNVREKPVLTLGNFELTQFWLFVCLTILLLSGFGAGWISYRLWTKRVEGKASIAKRNFSNLLGIINKDLEAAATNMKKNDPEGKTLTDIRFYSERAQQNLKKMEKYLAEEIEEISR